MYELYSFVYVALYAIGGVLHVLKSIQEYVTTTPPAQMWVDVSTNYICLSLLGFFLSLPLLEGVLSKLQYPTVTDFLYWCTRGVSACAYWVGKQLYYFKDRLYEYVKNLFHLVSALYSIVLNPGVAFVSGVEQSEWKLPATFDQWIDVKDGNLWLYWKPVPKDEMSVALIVILPVVILFLLSLGIAVWQFVSHPWIVLTGLTLPVVEQVLRSYKFPAITDLFYGIGYGLSVGTYWWGTHVRRFFVDIVKDYFINMGRLLVAGVGFVYSPMAAFVKGLFGMMWSLPSKFSEWYDLCKKKMQTPTTLVPPAFDSRPSMYPPVYRLRPGKVRTAMEQPSDSYN